MSLRWAREKLASALAPRWKAEGPCMLKWSNQARMRLSLAAKKSVSRGASAATTLATTAVGSSRHACLKTRRHAGSSSLASSSGSLGGQGEAAGSAKLSSGSKDTQSGHFGCPLTQVAGRGAWPWTRPRRRAREPHGGPSRGPAAARRSQTWPSAAHPRDDRSGRGCHAGPASRRGYGSRGGAPSTEHINAHMLRRVSICQKSEGQCQELALTVALKD